MDKNNFVYGKHVVYELLKSSSRVKELFLYKKEASFLQLAAQKKVKVSYKKPSFFQKISDQSQNVAALVKPFSYLSLKDLKSHLKPQRNHILVLDQIQNPFNFGSLIRSAKAHHFTAIIISKNNQVLVTPAVEKTAVGYANKIPIVLVTNINNALKQLKKWDFWIYGTSNSHEKSQNLLQVNFDQNSVLVLGSENKGIRPLVLSSCDCIIKIPIADDVESLNVAVAGGILMHHLFSNK